MKICKFDQSGRAFVERVFANRSNDNVQECLLLSISKLMKVKVFYNKEHHFWLQIFYSYGHVFVMILKRKNPGTIN